jgi:hypothetical protein
MTVYTYIAAIGEGFPNTQCHCFDDGTVYENIIYDQGDAIPPKEVLDAWIAAKIKECGWTKIKAERDRRKTAGGYKAGGNWYHSDDTSRIQQIGLVMLGANMPNNVMWKTMSGDFVQMTPTLAMQIFQSAMVSDMTIFATAEAKKAAMLQLSGNDLLNYDYLSGWPKIYGE